MPQKQKPINLALQGGGAYGAFTWGVLDALLEDGRANIEGISGTSAGAMNAALLASGYTKNGADGARERLQKFWQSVGGESEISAGPAEAWNFLFGKADFSGTPGYQFFDAVSHFFSPYVTNPFNLNPVRDFLEELIDFKAVRDCKKIQLFVSATNVHTGKIKVFHNKDITSHVIMASACLPYLFQAVEIDGIPYWDGGYMGNPALFPFFTFTETEDILLVQINPIERHETPRTAQDIANRINEITFNSSILSEFRAIEFVGRLIDAGKLERGAYKKVRMHRIDADKALGEYNASSKLNTSWSFLKELHERGRATAKEWLAKHWDAVGKHATLDLKREIS
jgi:NTE family protein